MAEKAEKAEKVEKVEKVEKAEAINASIVLFPSSDHDSRAATGYTMHVATSLARKRAM